MASFKIKLTSLGLWIQLYKPWPHRLPACGLRPRRDPAESAEGGCMREARPGIIFHMWFVYIIRNDTNKRFYIGVTKDIKRRITEHNRSKRRSVTHFGKYYLIYSEIFCMLKQARAREKQIKSYKGGNAFKKLLRERTGLIIQNTAPSSSTV